MMGKLIVGTAVFVVIYIIFAYACGPLGQCFHSNHDKKRLLMLTH